MSDRITPAFFNRELSWLEFNQRVLEEAKSPDNPLLERLKFLAITASNLDEFFMVRVGGLHMARKAGRRKQDFAGLSPYAQLREINRRTRSMMEELNGCYADVLRPALDLAGVRHAAINALSSEQEAAVFDLFRDELFPVITPLAIEPGKPAPVFRNLELHLAIRLRKAGEDAGEDLLAVMAIGRSGPRLVPLPCDTGYAYVRREEVVKRYAANWFPGYDILETASFRVTRNADMAVQEEEAPDLISGMEDVLEERKSGDCVRLEVEEGVSTRLVGRLAEQIPGAKEHVYRIKGVLNLKDFMALAFLDGFDELKVEPWPPQPAPDIVPNEPMFDQIARKDLLLYHPYQSFDPVLRFIEEAAADPATMAIKMVLYRTSSESPIIAALKRAAQNRVNVTVLMELKARFDEARNMEWALDLEQDGVQVIYGVKGYKTHAKVCLVVRREPVGIVRYCHFGTGNYNESTAKLYGDISYLTCNAELGADASAFFNALCGYAQPRRFNLISMAPVNLRDRLMALVDFEIDRARKGKAASIMVKVNALADAAMIEKLYEASAAGVKIRLNVRGTCCLRPGVEGMSENIEVSSIVDRYLEHARILYFHHGGKPQVFIASADWMPRNFDKRLEMLVPVDDPACKKRLIEILETHVSDTESSWILQPDGRYNRAGRLGEGGVRSQAAMYELACEAIAAARNSRRTRFEPHRPAK